MRLFSKVWDKIVGFIYKLYSVIINWLIFILEGVKYSNFPRVAGKINILNRGKIILGKNVTITSSNKSNPVGGGYNTSIYCSPKGMIQINDNVAISNSVIFSQEGIYIGEGTLIGGGCQIYDTDFHSLKADERSGFVKEVIKTSKVRIGNNVFLGCNTIILKGVRIGDNSIIGAGSVVSKSIPDGEIWGGNPAMFIKKI